MRPASDRRGGWLVEVVKCGASVGCERSDTGLGGRGRAANAQWVRWCGGCCMIGTEVVVMSQRVVTVTEVLDGHVARDI